MATKTAKKTRYHTDTLTDMELKRVYWIVGEFGGSRKVKLNEYIRNLIFDIRQRDKNAILTNTKKQYEKP